MDKSYGSKNEVKSATYAVVLVTCPTRAEGESLAEKLVETSNAACVNVIPGVRSIYRWEGKVEKNDEVMLVVKTRTRMVGEVTEFVKENHKYSVPEVVALSVRGGNNAYLNWIGANTNIVTEEREIILPDAPSDAPAKE
jgi:periplasmic divalent cation tolerance protein